MRILFVARSTVGHAVRGGMEINSHRVAAHLSGRGHTLGLLTTSGVDVESLAPVFSDVFVVPRTRPGKYSTRWWWGSARSVAVTEFRPHVIFSVSSAGGGVMAAGTRGVPVLVQSHGTAVAEVKSSLRTPGIREYAKILLNSLRIFREVPTFRRASLVVAVSDQVAQQLAGVPYRLPQSRLRNIPNGVDERGFAFSKAKRTAERDRLGLVDEEVGVFVGRLHVQKGADLALRSLAEPGSEARHLIIVGEGPQGRDLHALATTLGVGSRVHFVGQRDAAGISALLSAADAFIFPTRRREGLPLSILEASAAGLPILTTESCALPEDLAANSRICLANPTSVAASWPFARSVAEREADSLPERYREDRMLQSYEQIVLMLGAASGEAG